jgi:hypothetical protein
MRLLSYLWLGILSKVPRLRLQGTLKKKSHSAAGVIESD